MNGVPLFLAASTEQLAHVLLAVVLGIVACVGLGAVTLLLRVILPGVARAADASLARMRTRRLLLAGIVPLVGAALLARGVGLGASRALELGYLLLVALPLLAALVVGAMAGLPHVGGQVLGRDDAPPLVRGILGGLIGGLALLSWVLPPLGLLVSVLLAGWLLGIGLGGVVRTPGRRAAGDTTTPSPS